MNEFELEIGFVIQDPEWPKTLQGVAFSKTISKALAFALELTKTDMSGPVELAIVFASDHQQQDLNKKWRAQDKPTNVLSFPQTEPFAPLAGLLGDIVLARQTVTIEAQSRNIEMTDYCAHLVVHGFLHILGYDHQTDTQARQMEGLETKILAHLNIDDPYA